MTLINIKKLLVLLYFFCLSLFVFRTALASSLMGKFVAKSGFVASLPNNWFRIGNDNEELDVLSSSYKVEGAVIPRGQAEIILREITNLPGDSLLNKISINYHIHIFDQKILRPLASYRGACGRLYQLTGHYEIAPGANQLDTFLVCQIHGRTFLTLLTYWATDKVQMRWRSDAVYIARSLHVNEDER